MSSGSTPDGVTNTVLTWETSEHLACIGHDLSECWDSLDPVFMGSPAAATIIQNVYEHLLWYNGSNPTQLIPWLAKDYTISPDGKTVDFTLRSNITFADGDPLNSSAVFFSLNRFLITDSSTPFSDTTNSALGGAWTLQQLEDRNLSGALSGVPQDYSQTWVERVLSQNFVEITGPLTFVLHIQHPTASLPYLLATSSSTIEDPKFVMEHDLALWSTPSSDYLLPFPTLGGSYMDQMVEYFKDRAATCNTGITPQGCAPTYLDTSTSGSLAGTGPYSISSVAVNQSVVLQTNPHYWGGPYQFLGGTRIVPRIETIDIRSVPLQSDRTRDVTLAGRSGQPMMMDLNASMDPTRLFDVANQTDWVDHGQLVSVLANVTIFGPVTTYSTLFDPFVTNVTSPSDGQGTTYETFQPFADLRFRMAFADSVDLNVADQESDNVGQVAINAIPPSLPPAGAYNSSNLPTYHYDPLEVQNLLLSAMKNPIQTFHFINGTVAPPGIFNNTFGCATLGPRNQCSDPVTQNIILPVPVGDLPDTTVENSIASTINNVSQTYNMGLRVTVESLPGSQYFPIVLSGSGRQFYLYPLGWVYDYPWAGDFEFGIFSPSGFYMPSDGWNVTALSNLWSQLTSADARGDVPGVVSASNGLNALANRMVLFLWTFHQYSFFVEDNWNIGRLGGTSLDTTAGSLMNMFDFSGQASSGTSILGFLTSFLSNLFNPSAGLNNLLNLFSYQSFPRTLFLNPVTGLPVQQSS